MGKINTHMAYFLLHAFMYMSKLAHKSTHKHHTQNKNICTLYFHNFFPLIHACKHHADINTQTHSHIKAITQGHTYTFTHTNTHTHEAIANHTHTHFAILTSA